MVVLAVAPMCNLYSLNKKRDAIARFFRVSHNRTAAFEPVSAIFPGHMAPIIKQSEDCERELVIRSWGFILLRDGYAPKRVTNTRDDKAYTKFWKDSFENLRCLVPATAFCEPDEGKPANWHWFALKGMTSARCSRSPASTGSGRGPSRRTDPTSTSRCSAS
jgi:putative SOS response-associated peptidase YedK